MRERRGGGGDGATLRQYPYPNSHPLRRRCQVDLTAPDTRRFPLFERAPPALVAHLAPGDVVFFPPRYAHHVESLDLSISVTCRFKSRPQRGTSSHL